MDISSYAIHELLWNEFINDLYYVPSNNYKLFPKKGDFFEDVSKLFPKKGDVFEDVSKLFPKYFKHKKSINNKK